MKKYVFTKLSGEKFDLNDMLDYMFNWTQIQPEYDYVLSVATDGDEHGGFVKFATTVALHRRGVDNTPGNGAIGFVYTEKFKGKTYNVFNRLINETMLSVDLLNQLKHHRLFGIIGSNVIIHIDGGLNGKSKDVLPHCIGIINGNGFVAEHKPLASTRRISNKHSK